MASPPSSPYRSSTTSTRDYLFRALYLRRETLLLTMHSNRRTSSETPDEEEGHGSESASPAESPAMAAILHDVLLLPPLYGLDGWERSPFAAGTGHGVPPLSDPMLTKEHAWFGVVHVRAAASPWHGGCFAFYVYFPSRYPFEPPMIELPAPLPSHPLVQERRVEYAEPPHSGNHRHIDVMSSAPALSGTSESASPTPGKRVFISFEEVFAAIDPMRVSVMAALLRHVHRFFLPAEWPAAWWPSSTIGVDVVRRDAARRDVARCSVTQDVCLLRPYEQYVGTDVLAHFLAEGNEKEGGAPSDVADSTVRDGARWYTREVLPHLLHS